MVFPAKAKNHTTAVSKSFNGTSHAGETGFRSGVNQRCKFSASKIRTSKKRIAVGTGQKVLASANSTASHSNGHNVALDTMLQKYDAGWQARMVRAQRS